MSTPMVIVGAGQAGLQLAESLRSEGWSGPIRLIGDEPRAPYHRPPLSKQLLTGESTAAQLTIRGPEAIARKEIELVTGVTVAAIDRAAQAVVLSDGGRVAYAGLGLATGARARRLAIPGAELAGIVTLRNLDDAEAIAARLPGLGRLVVVGGGFIGLEVAAVARKAGAEVTLVEAAPRLMARAVSEPISQFYADLHGGHGVRILCDTGVVGFTGTSGRVTGVVTPAGVIAADWVVVGVGVIAEQRLAEAAGLACDRGIVVDACSRTGDPSIVAAGDCTARRMDDGSLRRLESVQNAVEQAKAAAAALMGKDKPFGASPWFWSDQYDVKLQMVGLTAGATRTVRRGAVGERGFSLFHWQDARLIAVESVDRGHDHMAVRRLLDRGVSPNPEDVADPGFDLAAAAKAV